MPAAELGSDVPSELVAFAKALKRALWRNLCVGAIAFVLGTAGIFGSLLYRGPRDLDDTVGLVVAVIVAVFGLAQSALAIALDKRVQRRAPVLGFHLVALAALATVPVGIAALPAVIGVAVVLSGGFVGLFLTMFAVSILPVFIAGTGLASAINAWRLAPSLEE